MKYPFLILFLLFAFLLKGENKIFNRVTTDAGLSSARINSILQDKEGYLWFATSEGLNRYDGFSFVSFRQEVNNPQCIQKNMVESLFEDKAGNLWMSFISGGFSYYNPKTEQFVNFKKEELEQQLRVYGKVTCFSSVDENTVWIGTENGLLTYQYSSGVLARNTSSSSVSFSLIHQINIAKDQSIWISTLSGFSRYHPDSNCFTDYEIALNDSTKIGSGTTCVHKDQKGYLWIGTAKKGAFKSIEPGMEHPVFQSVGKENTRVYQLMETWDGAMWIGHSRGASLFPKDGNDKPEHFFDQKTDLTPSGECQVRGLQEDRKGTVWFTDNRFNQGLFYYSPSIKEIGQLQHVPENPYTIASNQLACLYIDRFNNLWIGHDNYGISFSNLNESPFTYRFGYMNSETQLSSNHILAIHEDSNGDLWVGTLIGLDRVDQKTGVINKRYRFSAQTSESSLSGKIIGSITEDNEQNLWITYLDASPDIIDLKSLSVSPFVDDLGALNNAPKACKDLLGYIWFVTTDMGLIQYAPDNKRIAYHTESAMPSVINEDAYTNLYSICIDNKNAIWIGSEGGGLRRYNPSTDSFTNYRHIEGDKGSLISDYVRVLFCDNRGTLWIGTNAGLSKYNQVADSFDHFTVQDGLPGNVIQSIAEATPGMLFIGTNQGLSRMNTRIGDLVHYSTDNKLLTNEFIPGVSCLKKSGELAFGTNSGVMTFDPEVLQNEQTDVSLFFTDISVDGQRFSGADLQLPYAKSKDIRIDFLSFNYMDPLKNSYQYKLQGYDTEWKTTDSKHRYVHYSFIPPGKYTFLVRVSEDQKNWSYPILLPITVHFAWWQTWWFRIITTVLVLCFLYLIYRSRLRIYQIQQRRLEKKVEERTTLLRDAKYTLEKKNKEMEELYNKLKSFDEQKTAFFTNISHELRTPLTIIKGMTENLEQQGEQAITSGQWNNTLYTIQRNTQRLIRHVNELLDLATMDRGGFHPHITYSHLGKLLHELEDIFQPLAGKYQITFSARIGSDIQNAFFDKEIIEQALFNILSNAFKYTPDGGNILLTAEFVEQEGESAIRIVVADDGIGIPAESLPRIFDRYYQNRRSAFQRFESSGIGLAHTKEQIEKHFGTVSCQSKEGEGTILTLLFPVSETTFPREWVELKDAVSQSTIFRTEIRLSSLEDEEDIEVSEQTDKTDEKPTLLFVEDNRDLLHYLSAGFREEYRIVTAEDGEDGFHKALKILPDAIVSDIMMPVMDGLQLCEKLKTEERTAHIPVLLLTARAEEKQQLEGYYAGADDYILKPFNREIVRAKIKSLISRRQKLQSIFKDSFNLKAPEAHIPEIEKAFIRKATQVVLDNLQNSQFGVDEFCSEMAMSRANLFRKLKAATGLSASTFTRNIRLKKAAELLRQKEYPVNEVATLVGFSDANYLTRCFKDFYGVTPSQYV